MTNMFDEELYETMNGGDGRTEGNDLSIVWGLENMPYLAMFGSSGESGATVRGAEVAGAGWWGNELLLGDIPDGQILSETEGLLRTVALTSGNRVLIEDAVRRDLAFLERQVPGTTITVTVRYGEADEPNGNKKVEIFGNAGGQEFYILWNPKPVATPPILEPVPMTLWTSPIRLGESSAYAVLSFDMLSGGESVTVPLEVFDSTAEEEAWVVTMNSVFAPAGGLLGRFVIYDNSVGYLQGPGESWSVGDVVVLDKVAELLLAPTVPSGSAQGMEFMLSGNGGYLVADWGDSTVPDLYHPTDIFTVTATHTYAAGLVNRTLRLFHDDTVINYLRFAYTGSQYKVSTVSGTLPLSLTSFLLQNQKLTATCDLSVIDRLVSLELFVLAGSDVEEFVPDLLGVNMPALRVIVLTDNKLDASEVDKAFNKFVMNTPVRVPSGSFYTNLQTPTAAPTAASAGSRTALGLEGWTLVTD